MKERSLVVRKKKKNSKHRNVAQEVEEAKEKTLSIIKGDRISSLVG